MPAKRHRAALVRAIEDWAAERGVDELSVRCREDRAEARRFYEGLSFQYTKSQRVFRQRGILKSAEDCA